MKKLSILIAIGVFGLVSGLAAQAPQIVLVLNVPAYRLEIVREGRVEVSYGVAVGGPAHPTPVGSFDIDQVTWHPWWYPPPGEWAAAALPIAPGPSNPMGTVKMRFRPYYYLHGTPEDASIGHARSHGCVRMRNEDAVDLARRLHAATSTPLPADATRRTRAVSLTARVPLRVTYTLAELRDGNLLSHADVYRRSGRTRLDQALITLRAAGLSSAVIDEGRLRHLLVGAEGTITIPIAEILSPR